MTLHDAINAGFEAGLAVMITNNIRCLHRDKQVKGFSLWAVTWVTAWGFWNLYYYPAVNSPLSFWAGIAVVLANATWLGLALYYARAQCALACRPAPRDRLLFITPDEGRTWCDGNDYFTPSNELMPASPLTDRLQDYHQSYGLKYGRREP